MTLPKHAAHPPARPRARRLARGCAIALVALGAASCTDRAGPLAPDRAGDCRFSDDAPARTRLYSGACRNSDAPALPDGWVARRAEGAAPGRDAPAGVPLRGALASSSAAFSTISMPDAGYVDSTTKITWTNFSGTVLTDGVESVTFNLHVSWSQVPTFWATWSSPPTSESSTPRLIVVNALDTQTYDTISMTLARPATTFGFELEPDALDGAPFTVRYFSGDSLVGTIAYYVSGNAGARLFAAHVPDDRAIDRVTIATTGRFALAQIRYTVPTPPSLAVACTPNPVVRGATVRCAATVTPELPYTVVRRRAVTTDSGLVWLDENPALAMDAGAQYVWEGEAVTATSVLIAADVLRAGTTYHLSHETPYAVTPRSWPVPQLVGPTSVSYALAPPPGTMTAYPSNGVLGEFGTDQPTTFFNGVAISRPTQGPNKGIGFVADPFTAGGFTVWLHPGLQPPPKGIKPGQPGYQSWYGWHNDQNGKGSGTCTKTVWSTLDSEIRRHEGATLATNSHWGVATRAYRELALAESLERVYSAEMDGAIRSMEYDAWIDFHNSAAYQARQDQFDVTDTAVVNQMIGCLLDYNPNDP